MRRLFQEEEPNVALLDIDLPDGSGPNFLTEIKAGQPDAVVGMITEDVDVKNKVAALCGIAHDLNNIFSPILTAVDMLKIGTKNEETVRRLTLVMENAERGAKLSAT